MSKKFKPSGVYMNIKAEIARTGITQSELAGFLGVSRSAICNKINGKIPFSVPELVEIKKAYFPEATLDYLSKTD